MSPYLDYKSREKGVAAFGFRIAVSLAVAFLATLGFQAAFMCLADSNLPVARIHDWFELITCSSELVGIAILFVLLPKRMPRGFVVVPFGILMVPVLWVSSVVFTIAILHYTL